jgi:hypothetical protein
MTNKLLINEIEASERYGLSRQWFQRARWEGGGPAFVKMSARVLYPLEETDSYFKSRIVSSTSVSDSNHASKKEEK